MLLIIDELNLEIENCEKFSFVGEKDKIVNIPHPPQRTTEEDPDLSFDNFQGNDYEMIVLALKKGFVVEDDEIKALNPTKKQYATIGSGPQWNNRDGELCAWEGGDSSQVKYAEIWLIKEYLIMKDDEIIIDTGKIINNELLKEAQEAHFENQCKEWAIRLAPFKEFKEIMLSKHGRKTYYTFEQFVKSFVTSYIHLGNNTRLFVDGEQVESIYPFELG